MGVGVLGWSEVKMSGDKWMGGGSGLSPSENGGNARGTSSGSVLTSK